MLEYKDGKNKCSYCIFEDNCIECFLNRKQPDCNIFKPKIVHCKDCAYFEPEQEKHDGFLCQRLYGGMVECGPDSYCSDGVPKEIFGMDGGENG